MKNIVFGKKIMPLQLALPYSTSLELRTILFVLAVIFVVLMGGGRKRERDSMVELTLIMSPSVDKNESFEKIRVQKFDK